MGPETRYARTADGVHVAYQVIGTGSSDLLFVTSWTSHLEVQWEEPLIASFLTRLASMGRLALYDKRGVGLSDPVVVDDQSLMGDWLPDIDAVLDAAGMDSASVIGFGAGGPLSSMYAASRPERVEKLVLVNAWARLRWSEDYPFGVRPDFELAMTELLAQGWGTGDGLATSAPSLASDDSFRTWHRRHLRAGSSPGSALAMQKMMNATDVRDSLSTITAPTLVIHRTEDQMVPIQHGQYLASHIAGAELVQVEGADHPYWSGNGEDLLEPIERFLTGSARPRRSNRSLATVMFTDIVSSTEQLHSSGDAGWRRTIERHDAALSHLVGRFAGTWVNTTGDGMVATFETPSEAVDCAVAIRSSARELSLDVRIALHTGEIERRETDITGIAVVIAARAVTVAQAGEILVTSTVRDLVSGSGAHFEERGMHDLKGLPTPWLLLAVVD
jgi:class 3 adenylate cyclase/alpha-beta hydrolase superfamily lysophospholipase